MNLYMIIITIFINFILESTILNRVMFFGVTPNLGLILVVIIALSRGRKTGGLAGIITGLLSDIVFSEVIGIKAFIYFFIGYVVGMSENKLSRENIFIPIIMTIGSTFFYHLMYMAFMFFLNNKIYMNGSFKHIFLLELLYNSILVIPLYKWLSKYYTLKGMSFSKR